MALQVAEVTKPVSHSFCWWMGEAEWNNFSGPESSDHFHNCHKSRSGPLCTCLEVFMFCGLLRCSSLIGNGLFPDFCSDRRRIPNVRLIFTMSLLTSEGLSSGAIWLLRVSFLWWMHDKCLICKSRNGSFFDCVSALQGCSWSVIFVDLDAHNRNRQTLSSLLPRESRSHVSPSHFAFNSGLCIIVFVWIVNLYMCAVLMVYCWHDGENEKVTAEGEIQEASGKKKKNRTVILCKSWSHLAWETSRLQSALWAHDDYLKTEFWICSGRQLNL